MRRQGAALTPAGAARRRRVRDRPAGRIVSRAARRDPEDARTARPHPDVGDPLAGAAWNGFGGDLRNTRFQPAAAAGIGADRGAAPEAEMGVRISWRVRVGLAGHRRRQPRVRRQPQRRRVRPRREIRLHRLGVRSRCRRSIDAGRRAAPGADARRCTSATPTRRSYALDVATGKLRWKVKVDNASGRDDHRRRGVLRRTPLRAGVSSIEEGTAVIPTYECCTFRGSVVALDAATGTADLEDLHDCRRAADDDEDRAGTQLWGPSGGGVWSTPVLDPERNRMYVTTGDNYSNPPTNRRATRSWRSRWTPGASSGRRQALAGDAWNTGCLEEPSGVGRAQCPERAGARSRLRQRARARDARRTDGVCCSRDRSPACCTASTPTPATSSGRRRWATAACSAASSGDLRPTARARTSRCRARSRRNPAKPAASPPSNVADGRIKWRTPPPGRHLRRSHRMQHGSAGRGERDSRHGVLGESRRPSSRVRSRNRSGDLRHRHGARLHRRSTA